jgi:hypothetical protein
MIDSENKPNKLSECFECLNKILAESEDMDWFKNASEEDAVVESHHGLGNWIRSNWGLSSANSQLYKYLANLGLNNENDMSALILTSYHRHINKRGLELDEQARFYIELRKNKK